MKKRGLGKDLVVNLGLSNDRLNVLLSDLAMPTLQANPSIEKTEHQLAVELLSPGKYQPRRDMDEQKLVELADSISSQGVIQPIIVRPLPNHKFEIIAGERRWRAAQIAGLATVPVIVRDLDDHAVILIGLIENMQREDLNPVEEALALKQLIDQFGMTQEQAAQAVGKSRPMVSNLLRLLNLQSSVLTLLEHGDLDMGHARALLGLDQPQQLRAARLITEKNLSVREAEKLVKDLLDPVTRAVEVKDKALDPSILQLQKAFSEKIGAKVKIKPTENGKGKLEISYHSLAALNQLLERL